MRSYLPEYQLLQRVLNEQSETDPNGNTVAKDKKHILPSSLQNPSDPDATYRSKAGKDHKGYAGNLVETFDENVLRRRYQVDRISVRGVVRSKFWFAFKLMAINVKRVLKKASTQAMDIFDAVIIYCLARNMEIAEAQNVLANFDLPVMGAE